MGIHDAYGKRVLRLAAGDRYRESGAECRVDFGAGPGGAIDGVVLPNVAVEIEARVAKQIRGALLDLICHPFGKKLLVIIPAHAVNPELTARQCRFILERFVPSGDFVVIVLSGRGGDERLEQDSALVRAALGPLCDGEAPPHLGNVQTAVDPVKAQVAPRGSNQRPQN